MFKSRGSLDLQNKLTLAVKPIVDDAFIPCSRGSNRQCQRSTPQISMSLRCILHHQHEVKTLRALQQLALNQIIGMFVHCFIDGRIRSCCWKTLDTRGCCMKDGRTTLAPKDRRTCIRNAYDQTIFFSEYPRLSTYPVAFRASATPRTSFSSTSGALSSCK